MNLNQKFLNMNTFSKIVITSVFLCFFGFIENQVSGQTNNNFEITKNLDIYTTLYKELNKNYVDEIVFDNKNHLHKKMPSFYL